jgi:CRP-like cAMP-binding protein
LILLKSIDRNIRSMSDKGAGDVTSLGKRAMHALLTPEDFEIVKQINVLQGLPIHLVQHLVRPATVTILDQGDVLFRQGDRAAAFFIVAEGWVKLYRITVTGAEAVLNVLTKGDSFAEAVAFTNGIYPVNAEAVSKARVVRIPADHVIHCVRETPDIALAMIASTSAHLHHLVLQVEQLKAQTGVQRVAEFLVSLSPTKSGAVTIDLPYDKVLIAGRLGLKPESLSRAFAKLRPMGVEVRAAQVAIRDVAQLRRYAVSRQDAVPVPRPAVRVGQAAQ